MEAFKNAAGLADYVWPQSHLLSVSSIKSSSPYALEMNQEDAIEIQPLSQPPFTLRSVNIAMENGIDDVHWFSQLETQFIVLIFREFALELPGTPPPRSDVHLLLRPCPMHQAKTNTFGRPEPKLWLLHWDTPIWKLVMLI